jgi:hypothetical protein
MLNDRDLNQTQLKILKIKGPGIESSKLCSWYT